MKFRTAKSRKMIARITSSSIALSVLAFPVAADVICNPQSDHTNVRQGPSAKNFEIAGVLQNGDAITVLERVTNSDGYPWIKIEAPGLQDTYVGYVTDGAVAPSCDNVQAGVRPPYGMCFYVMAARQSTAEVQEYIRDFDQRTNGQFEADWAVAKSENGWYAVTIGPVETDNFESTKERLISEGLSPDDAYCSDGKKYVEFVDIQVPAAETTVTETLVEDVDLSKLNSPHHEDAVRIYESTLSNIEKPLSALKTGGNVIDFEIAIDLFHIKSMLRQQELTWKRGENGERCWVTHFLVERVAHQKVWFTIKELVAQDNLSNNLPDDFKNKLNEIILKSTNDYSVGQASESMQILNGERDQEFICPEIQP